jgi:hypothetical protein
MRAKWLHRRIAYSQAEKGDNLAGRIGIQRGARGYAGDETSVPAVARKSEENSSRTNSTRTSIYLDDSIGNR